MKKTLLSVAAIAIALCSCTEKNELNSVDNEVRISSNIASRAGGTAWEVNDEIGVYMCETGNINIGQLGANVLHTTATGNGVFSSTTPLYFPDANVDLLAYYPYNNDPAFNHTSYNVDVSDQSNFPAIDLMASRKDNVVKTASFVDLTFDHKLSNVKFNILAGTGVTDADLAGLVVKIKGTCPTTTYNIETDVFSLPNSVPTDITLQTAADGKSSEGILIPQTLSGVKLVVSTLLYTDFEADITTPTFASGQQYVYTVTVNRTEVQIESTTINPWTADSDTSDDILTADKL